MTPDRAGEDAADFWKGYTRPPQMTADLLAALSAALYAEPDQRLGQLIVNVTRERDLFNVYDEELLRRLRTVGAPGGSTEGGSDAAR